MRLLYYITYVNQNEFPLNSRIENSHFESNLFLLKRHPTLIEYASFFGSTQIFKYLYLNGVKLTSSLWVYSIHSDNPELIYILEENHIKPKDETYYECFYESIKCHHNEMALYIMNNYIKSDSKIEEAIFFKNFNFHFIELNDIKIQNLFFISCNYNYTYLFKILLEKTNFDMNSKNETIFDVKGNLIKKIKTALFIATEKGFIDIVKLLLENNNIDVNLPERSFSIESEFDENENDNEEEEEEKIYREFSCSNAPLTIAIENGHFENSKAFIVSFRN